MDGEKTNSGLPWPSLWASALEAVHAHKTSHAEISFKELARQLNERFPEEQNRIASVRSFLDWVRSFPALHPLHLAGLSVFCLENGLREEADDFATSACAERPYDLEIAELVKASRNSILGGLTDSQGNDVFCVKPFEHFEIMTNGNVHLCCSAWLPRPIGNVNRQGWEEIWNSQAAQEIRSSVHDASLRYCNKVLCPLIAGGMLPRASQVARRPGYKRIIEDKQVTIKTNPVTVNLSHDRTCNLECPSCRTTKFIAKGARKAELERLAEEVILPLLKNTKTVNMTGSGDPFASQHFRYLLKNVTGDEFRKLKVNLQTNGVLFDEKAWNDLQLEGKINEVIVSIDACSEATYRVVRKGGDFQRLLRNLQFISRLRAQKRIKRLRLDFVVQWRNFSEIPGFVALGNDLAVDQLAFQAIYNWGTFTKQEFVLESITNPHHPDYERFLDVLALPDLDRVNIDWGNIRQFREYALKTHIDQQRKSDVMELEREIERAREAMRNSEWDKAVSNLRQLCELEPRWAEIRTDLGRALRLSWKLQEAETLLAATIKRFPEHTWAGFEHAMVASYREDWDAALARFARFRQENPDEVAGYAAGGEALIGAGRHVEADRLLAEAMERFPNEVWPAYTWAIAALKGSNWEEAIRRAAEVRRRFPDHPKAYLVGGEALIGSSRLDEAEAVLAEAQRRFSSHEEIAKAVDEIVAARASRSKRELQQETLAEAPAAKVFSHTPQSPAEPQSGPDTGWLKGAPRWVAPRRK